MSTLDDEVSGSELRRRRKALGLTQAAIAELLGITPTSVARWERGEQRPSRSRQLRALLDELRAPRVVTTRRRRPGKRPSGQAVSQLQTYLTS